MFLAVPPFGLDGVERRRHGDGDAIGQWACGGYTRGAFYSNFSSKEELFFALFDAHSERIISRLTELIDSIDLEGFSLDRFAELLPELESGERDWFLVTTEFTLHAIRDRQAAWVLARHDARLRAQIARALTECVRGAGLALTVDPEELARLLIAVREGELAQSYVEPDQLPPGELGRRYLAPLLSAVTVPVGDAPLPGTPGPGEGSSHEGSASAQS
ncbi:TetR/AcrR family transcriptional regulator [Streptomyces sp. NPDC048496]|uniref:TetR/AcrR family transcriptional regulator n=1 Tax=Streptomyces sp. NPDC048496 TaxID=3365558 RepID=UPI00371F2C94